MNSTMYFERQNLTGYIEKVRGGEGMGCQILKCNKMFYFIILETRMSNL